MKLNDITTEYKRASEHLEALFNNEEITEDVIGDSLSGLEMEFESKVLSLANYVFDTEQASECLKERITALQARKKALDNKAERIRDYIKQNMIAVSKPKIEGLDHVVSLRTNPASLVIEDEELLPSDYLKAVTNIEVDKKKLKEDLNLGLSIQGAKLVQGTSLRIS